MNLKSYKPFALVLICLLMHSTYLLADELRLRDGSVIKADESWQRGNEVWYRQGQIIRSVPVSEVLQENEIRAAEVKAPVTRTNRKSARRTNQPAQVTPLVSSVATPIPTTSPTDSNAKPITRIIFKDGVQFDTDASWETATTVGYRLGNIQAFIDKSEIAQILTDFVPPAIAPANEQLESLPFTTGHAGLDQLITNNAQRHDVDPLLIYLVMKQESSFNYRAVSRAGARGLMQLMPGTARSLGVRNIHDPTENVEAGTRYLKNLLLRFSGDINLALAAYNAGEDAVARYGNRVPPYRETINYVRRISWAYQQYRK